MTDIPTPAVEAAARALCAHDGIHPEHFRYEHPVRVPPRRIWTAYVDKARAALTAAAPHIEARATDDLRARIKALRDDMLADVARHATIPGARIGEDTLAHYADALDALDAGGENDE